MLRDLVIIIIIIMISLIIFSVWDSGAKSPATLRLSTSRGWTSSLLHHDKVRMTMTMMMMMDCKCNFPFPNISRSALAVGSSLFCRLRYWLLCTILYILSFLYWLYLIFWAVMHCGGLLAFWHLSDAAALNIPPWNRNKSADCAPQQKHIFAQKYIFALTTRDRCRRREYFLQK